MKKAHKYILFIPLIFLSILTVTVTACANAAGGDSSSSPAERSIPKQNFAVYDVNFNSINYTLTAKTTAPNGTTLAASANNYSTTAVVSKGAATWTMDQSFNASVKGAKDYTITFSAEGYNETTAEVFYLPKVKYEISAKSQEKIFNGSGATYNYPELIVKNYDESDVTVNWWFRIAGGNCDIEDFREFVDDENNTLEEDGQSAYLYYEVYPNSISDNTQGNSLYESDCIEYSCIREVGIDYVEIENLNCILEAKTYTANPNTDSSATAAGGKVSYQWQKFNQFMFTDIAGATGKTYELHEHDVGERFRVIVTQTWQSSNKVLEPKTSEAKTVSDSIKFDSLYYDGSLLTGEAFDTMKIKGELTTAFGTKYFLSNCSISPLIKLTGPVIISTNTANESLNSMDVSQNVDIKLTHSYLESYSTSVYVTVQQRIAESELPELSTAVNKITDGHVDFTSINYDLEFSNDNKQTWTEIPKEEFTANAGDVFYFRKKGSGIANTPGYIKASEALPLTVQTNNVGKVITGGSAIESLKYTDLKIIKSTKNGNIIITPYISHRQDYYYKYGINYEIDGRADSDSWWEGKGIYKNDNNCLIIEKDSLLTKGETYQINCVLEVYVEGDNEIEETEKDVILTLNRQISVTIQ
ncbi:hypothetical protein [Treponema sp. C6A8]|uniref:hypothetical protein n=1 Tax=Treponema sp. C6A8 TaxID=1410609 RepID=UPI0004883E5B|nr:hypothetical protein [Treponema sp. C6A8]